MTRKRSRQAFAGFIISLSLFVVASASAAGRTYYFSDCQPGAAATCAPGKDSNPGTSEKSPKQTLASVNINALPAGSKLLLARGGVWLQPMVLLDNPHVTAEEPLVIDAYGSGELPWLQAPDIKASVFLLGTYNNTSYDGGYTFRNLKIDGRGSSQWGFFLSHNLHHVTIENTEITGFHIGIHTQARAPRGVNNVLIRNNTISRNHGMGILGQMSDSVIEGNLFEGNNFSGSGFDHAIYLSGNDAGGRNNVVRNNIFRQNSVVKGVCSGGNVTMHGQMDGMLIEGNTIEQKAASMGCWGFSITTGYTSGEWFRNFVVRNNTVINLGGCAFCINSSPGIVVENNRVFNDQSAYHVAVRIGGKPGAGDEPDRDAVVRNNIACFPKGDSRQSVALIESPGAKVTGNVAYTGAAATTGACAR
ncbi:MAG: right-handed parallel beta-helix repeat-containing protein [Rhizobacter sp.]|nr:right-handed parallel beta-helix repeat-containing protein [Rhizobacter sp.]